MLADWDRDANEAHDGARFWVDGSAYAIGEGAQEDDDHHFHHNDIDLFLGGMIRLKDISQSSLGDRMVQL